MSLIEALRATFDTVPFDCADYPEQPGNVRCCGALVKMRNGRIECHKCGKAIVKVDGEWQRA